MTWERITFSELARRTAEGWLWQKSGGHLQLISPQGEVFDFKLQGKPYLRTAKKGAEKSGTN